METLNEKQQLEVIAEMLQRTRHRISSSSTYYLLWGWLVLASTSIQWIAIHWWKTEYHYASWIILMPLGGLITLVIGRNQGKKQAHYTWVDKAMAYLWGGVTVGIFLSLLLSSRLGWGMSYLIIIMFYGLGTFISGGILGFKPLIWGGVFSWALIGVIALWPTPLVEFDHVLALMGVSIVCSYLVPGYWLKAQKSKYV